MNKTFQKRANQSGQGLTEYLILMLVVAIACIGVSRELGKAVHSRIERAKEQVQTLRDTHNE